MSVEPDLRSCQLKPGEYAVINFITVDAATNPIPLKSLIEHLRKCGSALRQINPRCPSTLVAEFPAGITVRAVIPAAANGGLFGPQDPQSSPAEPASAAIDLRSNNASTTPTAQTLEATALRNAEYLATEARTISIKAVDVGNDLASRAEIHAMDAEDLPELLANSPDQAISRATYTLARGAEMKLDYITATRTIGGNRQTPANHHSRETFALRGCRLVSTNTAFTFTMRGHRDDPEWHRLIQMFPDCMEVRLEEESPELPFVTESVLREIPNDLDICVAERVGTGKHTAIPLRVCNRDAVIDSLASRLQLLTELAANE